MRSATCSECGMPFTYSTRGSRKATCSEACAVEHRRRQARRRAERWARRFVAAELLAEGERELAPVGALELADGT